MINVEPPKIYFIGSNKKFNYDRYQPGFLQKVCIDYHSRKIRGSLMVRPECNDPIFKKKEQWAVLWFSFDCELIELRA